MKFRLFLLFLVITIGCKKNINNDHIVRRIFYSNGNIKAEKTYKIVDGDSILDGYLKKYDSLGKLTYFAETSNGKFHGRLEGYFSNGNIEYKGRWSKNKHEGDFYTYYNNNSKLKDRIKIKAFKANDSIIFDHYYYAENGDILEYHFFNHLAQLIYYEKYNSEGEIISSWGNKVPLILKQNSLKNNTISKNNFLQLNIICIYPPTSYSTAYTRIKGYDSIWKPLQKKNNVEYCRKMDSIGDFRFEVKYKNSNDSKTYINGFDFKVIN